MVAIQIGGDDLIGGEVFFPHDVLRPGVPGIAGVLAPDYLVSQRPRRGGDVEIAIGIEVNGDGLEGARQWGEHLSAPGTGALGGSLVLVPDQLMELDGNVFGPHPPGQNDVEVAVAVEVGGVPVGDGWFRLPLTTPRRTPEEIKPNKRSLYTKRYLLLDGLSAQIREQLAF